MLPTPPVVHILGLPISRLGLGEAVSFCAKRAELQEGGFVCFANVHSVTEAQENPSLHRALGKATLALADGTPLVWLTKFGPHPIASRVCGPDFMARFLKEFPNIQHGFIGGAPGQAESLKRIYSLNADCYSPPMRPFSDKGAIEDWNAFQSQLPAGAQPQVVWIGLGAPKQELWMETVSGTAPNTLFFGVGAAFDFLALTKDRAPAWMQKTGLEWFYRFLQEPKRLWKRYLITNSKFIAFVLRDKFRLKE